MPSQRTIAVAFLRVFWFGLCVAELSHVLDLYWNLGFDT